jgi:DNA-binding SARP family transcriptional activator
LLERLHKVKDDATRVSVLGPVEASGAGRPVRLSGSGQPAVLAALAAQHGTVVPVASLVEIVWGAAPPPTARTKIQSHVSALRLALGCDIHDADSPLHTIPPGYVLSADRARVDATDFGGLLARARQASEPAAAAALLGEALALWRGPAFTGLSSPALRAAASVLDGRRLLAIEDKAAADLALRRCGTVISEIAGWVDAYPLRERLRGLLMQALHQHGCRADALRLYLAGRQAMRRELGVEPSVRLQSLYHSILSDAHPVPAAQGA